MVLAVYVDDIILATKDERKLVQLKKAIANKFTVKDMGELKYILGVNIHHSENAIWIGQRNYTENVLKKFNMDKSKSVSTPVDTTTKLTQTDGNRSVDEQIYQSARSKVKLLIQITSLKIGLENVLTPVSDTIKHNSLLTFSNRPDHKTKDKKQITIQKKNRI